MIWDEADFVIAAAKAFDSLTVGIVLSLIYIGAIAWFTREKNDE